MEGYLFSSNRWYIIVIIPKSSTAISDEFKFNPKGKKNKKMINSFLIINCTGKNNSIGLKSDNKFFKEKLQNNINSNNQLVSNIINFVKKYKVKLSDKYSIIVNMGPGSYSSIRISLSVAKGIQIVLGSKLYGYKNNQLSEFKLENIEILIKNKQLKNKMINPIYE